MDIQLPDGTLLKGIPEGTTKTQLADKLHLNGYDVTKLGIKIDPETNMPHDPSIPTSMTLEAGRNAKPYEPTKMEKLVNAWETSKLEGLTPEVNPIGIGAIANMPVGKTTSALASTAFNAAKNTTAGQKLGNALQMIKETGQGLAQIPGELIPSNIVNGFNLGKLNNPYFNREFALGKLEGLTADAAEKAKKSGIYNYAKAIFGEGINKNEAEKAANYADVWKQKKLADELMNKAQAIGGRGNYTLPENASIMLPEGVQVQPGGVTGNIARQIGNEATWFPNSATLGDFLKTKSHLLGLASSPRINTNIGFGVGKVVDSLKHLPQATLNDLVNFGILESNKDKLLQEQQ